MSTKAQKKISEDELKRMIYTYSAEDEVDQLENENRVLRETVAQLQSELIKFQQPALMLCEIADVTADKKHATIKVPNGNQFFVNITGEMGGKVQPGDTVLCEQKNLTVVRKVPSMKKFDIERFVIMEKPTMRWQEVGGLAPQIQEIREVLELPLQKPELFKKMGIEPPKGVLLYGPPGTGKTILAKAVAAATNSTFIEIDGSELVQKFIGEGAKLVKEVFELAREKGPSIIFIDEIDSLAAKRIEIGTSGEREVQRTFMQLLAELDGFTALSNVKIIGATNRKDILDPAILRPGRLDRLIQVPNPTGEGIAEVFDIHTRRMKLSKNLDKERIVRDLDGFSGAEIKSVCTEAGYFAIRKEKVTVTTDDFLKAVEKVRNSDEFKEHHDAMAMFG